MRNRDHQQPTIGDFLWRLLHGKAPLNDKDARRWPPLEVSGIIAVMSFTDALLGPLFWRSPGLVLVGVSDSVPMPAPVGQAASTTARVSGIATVAMVPVFGSAACLPERRERIGEEGGGNAVGHEPRSPPTSAVVIPSPR